MNENSRRQAVARIVDLTASYSRSSNNQRLLLNCISSCFPDVGSQVWPFGATWRYRSCDHSTRCRAFFGGPLEPSIYLKQFPRYAMVNV